MGKSALLAIAAFTVLGAFYSLSTERSVLEADRELTAQEYKDLAINAAETGFERAKQKLADDFTEHSTISETTYGEHGAATYEVTFEDNDTVIGNALEGISLSSSEDEIMTTSTGTVERPGEEPITVKIVSVFKLKTVYDDEILSDVPEWLRKAIASGSDLDLNGNNTIEASELLVQGSDGVVYNADIHTNGELTLKGNASTIRGFGTHVDGENVNHDGAFDPYDNSAGDDVVQQVEPLDIPTDFDPAAIYAAHFSENKKQSTGDVNLSENQNFIETEGATREDPLVWHIQGDLTTDGNVNIDGYVTFLVEGNINFTGNMRAGASGSDQTESHMAFYTASNVDIGSNVKLLSGQIFSKGNVTLHGTPEITGNIVAGQTVSLKGTPDIYYYPASPALTRIFEDPTTVMELTAHSVW